MFLSSRVRWLLRNKPASACAVSSTARHISGAAANRGVTAFLTCAARCRHQVAHSSACVVEAQDKRPQARVPDDGQRAWIDLDALEVVEMQAQAVSHDCLDHVAV